jgi:hypothetical protein
MATPLYHIDVSCLYPMPMDEIDLEAGYWSLMRTDNFDEVIARSEQQYEKLRHDMANMSAKDYHVVVSIIFNNSEHDDVVQLKQICNREFPVVRERLCYDRPVIKIDAKYVYNHDQFVVADYDM